MIWYHGDPGDEKLSIFMAHVRGFIDKKWICPIDKPSFRDIFYFRMAMFGVTRGKVECESFLGLGWAKEQVLHCEPIEAGDYSISHALLGLDFNIGPDDSVSLVVGSIKKLGGNKRGRIKFGESIVALDILRVGNEQLILIPNYGHTALEIGPDEEGITISLTRYRSPKESLLFPGQRYAPKDIGQRIAHKFTKVTKPQKSRGGAGSG